MKFVRDTHYCFTGSRDMTVKYWDCDSYDLVLEFKESIGEVWSIAVSSIGDYFVTGGNEKMLRVYKQGND